MSSGHRIHIDDIIILDREKKCLNVGESRDIGPNKKALFKL